MADADEQTLQHRRTFQKAVGGHGDAYADDKQTLFINTHISQVTHRAAPFIIHLLLILSPHKCH